MTDDYWKPVNKLMRKVVWLLGRMNGNKMRKDMRGYRRGGGGRGSGQWFNIYHCQENSKLEGYQEWWKKSEWVKKKDWLINWNFS